MRDHNDVPDQLIDLVANFQLPHGRIKEEFQNGAAGASDDSVPCRIRWVDW